MFLKVLFFRAAVTARPVIDEKEGCPFSVHMRPVSRAAVLTVCVCAPRTMYWADWGNHPKIETAAMDGTLRQTLVHENIQWPTGPC